MGLPLLFLSLFFCGATVLPAREVQHDARLQSLAVLRRNDGWCNRSEMSATI
jgi:hypothetical protein